MKNQNYTDFAKYYDMLGWNKFSHVCAERLHNFIRFRGVGNESVLDLACGTGELEYKLRNTNLKFTGVDLSMSMLTQARRKINGVKFIHGDITSVRLKQKYDIAVCFFDSVNHLSGITAVRKLFKTARVHLRKGGFFIFDMLTPDGLSEWESVDIRRKPDHTVIVNGFYDSDKITAEINIEGFIKSGRNTYNRFIQNLIERSYNFDTVAESLEKAGFDNISVSAFNPDEHIKHTSRWFFTAG
ncbi:MAG: class I SAM-dependent methyltransferase [candidate division Zixibacteria bacterium]|nr:class I SAM-dependent methyltransferase [candidate division Zixibacteria bacterium]